MTFDGDLAVFRESVLRELARQARSWAQPHIPSRTLRGSMTVVSSPAFSAVRLSHYWAVFIHDGTEAIARAPTKLHGKQVFVFFPNKRNDPRVRGGYPERVSQMRGLTDAEYKDGLARNRARRKRGLPPVMVVVAAHRAMHPKPGVRFFDNRAGMAGFPQHGAEIVSRRFDQFVRKQLPTDKQSVKIKLA